MTHDDQLDTERQGPAVGPSGARYRTSHMGIVAQAQERAAHLNAVVAAVDADAAEVDLTGPVAKAMSEKMSAHRARFDADPIVLAHRNMAPIFHLVERATGHHARYLELTTSSDELDSEIVANEVRSDLEVSRLNPSAVRPLIRFE